MTSLRSATFFGRVGFGFSTLLLLTCPLASAEPVDIIYTARYVLPMDGRATPIENGAVAIRGERIVAVGPRADIDKQYQAKQRVDRPEALILPGLINTHTHAAMSLLRGIADDLRLQDWLQNYIFPAEKKNVKADFVLWGTRLACLEMMLSGTTTFVDMYYFEEQVAQATREAGMRGVLGETIIGFPDPDSATPADALILTEAFIKRFQHDSLIVPAVAPHAIYTNDDKSLRNASQLARRYNVPLLIHVGETKKEDDDARATRGMSPTRLLESLGVLDGRVLIAHGIWLDDADMQILKKHGVGVAHNPSSNMKLSSGVAPVLKLLGLGIPVGLGTDGPAGSNNDFDLMEEMNLASNLQKITTMDPTALPARQAIEMATILGARAIGMDKEIGSLEPGKRADLITLRLDRPHAVPLYNVWSQVVYALKGSDVADVVVNGRQIVRDGRSLTLDPAVVLPKAREYAQQVKASLSAPRP